MCLVITVQARRQGGGGFGGVRSNPPFDLQTILNTPLNRVHFKYPTIEKWYTSLAVIENHRCPYESGCSYRMRVRSWKTGAVHVR